MGLKFQHTFTGHLMHTNHQAECFIMIKKCTITTKAATKCSMEPGKWQNYILKPYSLRIGCSSKPTVANLRGSNKLLEGY